MKYTFGLGMFALLTVTHAQTPSASHFEIADVHRSPRRANPVKSVTLRDGRYEAHNETMVDLIATAFDVPTERVLGGSSWLDFDLFDVVARVPPASTLTQTPPMLALLVERFGLVAREDRQPVPVFALKAGAAPPRIARSERRASGADACQPLPQTADTTGPPSTGIACRGITMEAFAQALQQFARGYLDRPVIDATGLAGAWDFDVAWTPRAQLAASGGEGVTIFDALPRQLGLTLEPTTQPSAVVRVSAANEQPTPNAANASALLGPVSHEFEAATIKPSAPGTVPRPNIQPGGRVDLQGATLHMMLSLGWNVAPETVIAPSWMDTDRFDVTAKAPPELGIMGPTDDLRDMLAAFLVRRFNIRFHEDVQPLPAYVLLPPKSTTRLQRGDVSARGGCQRDVTAQGGKAPVLPIGYVCRNITMAQFAERLPDMAQAYIDRDVIDATGLDGVWDFSLHWAPKSAFAANTPTDGGGASDPNGAVTLFEAVEKELGLKLELQKQPRRVIVIDTADRSPQP